MPLPDLLRSLTCQREGRARMVAALGRPVVARDGSPRNVDAWTRAEIARADETIAELEAEIAARAARAA